MRCILSLLVGGALVTSVVAATTGTEVCYKVALIRATDDAESLPAGSTHVSPELAEILHGPLKWEHYWKVCEKKVAVTDGAKKKVLLINDREVEIDLSVTNKRTVIAYQSGKVLNKSTVCRGQKISLMGGKRDEDSGWFVVVRRDEPKELKK
jgi:hypothetical protein